MWRPAVSTFNAVDPYDWYNGPFDDLDRVTVTLDRYGLDTVDGRVVDYNHHTRLVTVWVSDAYTIEVNIENVHFADGSEVA